MASNRSWYCAPYYSYTRVAFKSSHQLFFCVTSNSYVESKLQLIHNGCNGCNVNSLSEFNRLAWAVHSFVHYIIIAIINACNDIYLICNSLPKFVRKHWPKKFRDVYKVHLGISVINLLWHFNDLMLACLIDPNRCFELQQSWLNDFFEKQHPFISFYILIPNQTKQQPNFSHNTQADKVNHFVAVQYTDILKWLCGVLYSGLRFRYIVIISKTDTFKHSQT